jgi:hypothetical protein
MTYLNGIVHSHRKTENVFWQLEVFDVCTKGDTAHIGTIFKFLPTRVNMGVSIFFTAAMIRAVAMVGRTGTSHHCHMTSLT